MLSKEQILERNRLIGQNGLATRMKRAKQTCKTFSFKIERPVSLYFLAIKWDIQINYIFNRIYLLKWIDATLLMFIFRSYFIFCCFTPFDEQN